MTRLLLSGALALALAAPASAQLQLSQATFSGGAVEASGGSLTLRGTIGQPAVGTATGGSLALCQGFWCGAGLPAEVELMLTMALQGAYATGAGTMRTALAANGDLPSTQPYGAAAYDGTPLDYDGTESATVPADAVDWVLVELRTSAAAADSVTTAAALLKADGTAEVAFPGIPAGSYFVVARHRNHLPAITAAAVSLASSGGVVDLTAAGAAGGTGVVEVASGVWALWAADGSLDGLVTAPDFNLYSTAAGASASGYVDEDYTLDGLVTAPDFNVYSTNAGASATSAVPKN